MFRTSYVYHQEDYIVHAALYGMFVMHLCKQSSRSKDVIEHSMTPGFFAVTVVIFTFVNNLDSVRF
jgi:hypothetical protein